eukprot:SAG22_NODE_2914_length_2108_cov_1.711299_2_plen_119_part_01
MHALRMLLTLHWQAAYRARRGGGGSGGTLSTKQAMSGAVGIVGWTFRLAGSELIEPEPTGWFSTASKYVEYVIEVQVSGLPPRTIRKRYSLFEELHQHILATQSLSFLNFISLACTLNS